MGITLLYPRIYIERAPKPVLFLDTYIWHYIFDSESQEEHGLLYTCCKNQKVTVVITDAIEGELKNHNLIEKVQELCGNSLFKIPVGQITANQTIQSMTCFFENKPYITLSWDLMILNVPIFNPAKRNLKQILEYIAKEINEAVSKSSGDKEQLIKEFCRVEIEAWKQILGDYKNFFKEKGTRSFDGYFFTDFFVNLPSIVIRSYLFAYIAKEKTITVQDVIDVYTISELIPFVNISVIDKAQHERLKRLQRDYPGLFNPIEENTFVSSFLNTSKLTPLQALKSFLNYINTESIELVNNLDKGSNAYILI